MPSGRPISVAVDLPLRTGDEAFTFAAGAAVHAAPGTGVIVPFGARLVAGVVLGDAPSREGLRPVVAATEGLPLVPPDILDLARWTANEYLSSIGEVLAVATPWAALWAGVRVDASAGEDAVDPPYRQIIAALRRRPATLTRAARMLSAVPNAVSVLAEQGALRVVVGHGADATVADSAPGAALRSASTIGAGAGTATRWSAALTSALSAGRRSIVLAGWDRGAAYRHAIAEALRRDWSCIAACATVDAATTLASMLRDTGLAPTLLYGDQKPRARVAAWRSLIGQRRALVIGTRSAIFAPVAGPLLAIVDDDDHSGHKEERAPRFVTAAVAEHRARDGATILGAATPTVAAFVRVRAGAAALVTVPSPRFQIGVVDNRRRRNPDAAISPSMADLVRREVRGRGRVVILADRKGYAGGLHCAECGAVPRCGRCGVAMAFERTGRRLRCRSCGATLPAPASCARCGGTHLHAIGAGTERVAAAARTITSAVWRLDSDTIAGGGDLDPLLEGYRARGGIIVATVIVLPHLAALRPSLVAVVGADRWLHRPEYRATERALALLRTLGMATRTRVLVETSDPTHPVLQAIGGSLRPWYEAEATLRETLGYPPFRVLAAVTITGSNEDDVARTVEAIQRHAAPPVEVLGLGPVDAAPRRGLARRMVIKAPSRGAVHALLWPYLVGIAGTRRARVAVDVDPLDLA